MQVNFRDTKRYQIIYEILNAVTHGVGFLLATAGYVVLLVLEALQHRGPFAMTAFAIYGASVCLFLLMSTLFHSLVFTRARRVFQIFDHAGIFLVIFGSYTPYCWIAIGGWQGWTIWSVILAMTIAGILYEIFFVGRWLWLSVIIYIIMGWMIVLALPTLWHSISHLSFWLLFAGGVTYTLGAGIYSIKKIPFGHVWWHIFVIAGATLMYFSILFSV